MRIDVDGNDLLVCGHYSDLHLVRSLGYGLDLISPRESVGLYSIEISVVLWKYGTGQRKEEEEEEKVWRFLYGYCRSGEVVVVN